MAGSDTSNIVVRARSPRRRLIVAGALALVCVIVLDIFYEWGRFDAGYDRLAARQQRGELSVTIEHLEKSNRALRTQLAELETIRIGRAREQAEVARAMGELQAQVARQAQELAFYRGIVGEGAAAIGVRVDQLRIAASPAAGHFVLHLGLVRSVRPDNNATGVIALTVEGLAAGKPTSLDLAALTAGRQTQLAFNFQYLQRVDQDVGLPSGFEPRRVEIELRSARKEIEPARQSFPWRVDAM